MKKRVLSVLLCTAMAISVLAGCGGSDNGGESESDKAYVEDKGTLVVGITNFEPMDYKDESGEWVGFDADLAKAFAESLGVEAEFVEIDWDNKIMELDGKMCIRDRRISVCSADGQMRPRSFLNPITTTGLQSEKMWN